MIKRQTPIFHDVDQFKLIFLIFVAMCVFGVNCSFYTHYVKILPLGTVETIFPGSQLLFGTLIAIIVIKQKIQLRTLFLIILCLVGLTLTCLPAFVNTHVEHAGSMKMSSQPRNITMNNTGISKSNTVVLHNAPINGQYPFCDNNGVYFVIGNWRISCCHPLYNATTHTS